MKINEILSMQPMPYQWLDALTATFQVQDDKYGIVLEERELQLPTRKADICNVSFGLIIDPAKPLTDDNLNTSLSGSNKPRTVLSTVAAACVENATVLGSDIICLAAYDQLKLKRANIYLLGVTELQHKMTKFTEVIRMQVNDTGHQLVILSKLVFTDEEIEFIKQNLSISK